MYKVTIEGISDAKLGEFVAQIGTKKYPVQVTYYSTEQEDVKLTNGKARLSSTPSDIVSLTGKSAMKGSNRERILLTLEKLEKKHGIGTVSRLMLRTAVGEADGDAQIIYQLIRDNYIKTKGA